MPDQIYLWGWPQWVALLIVPTWVIVEFIRWHRGHRDGLLAFAILLLIVIAAGGFWS